MLSTNGLLTKVEKMGPLWVVFRCHIHTLMLKLDLLIEARVLQIKTFILAPTSQMHLKAHT